MKTKILESSANEDKRYIICVHKRNMPYDEYEPWGGTHSVRYKSFQKAMAETLELKMAFPDTFKIFEVSTTYKVVGG
jgi:hypothetical protein